MFNINTSDSGKMTWIHSETLPKARAINHIPFPSVQKTLTWLSHWADVVSLLSCTLLPSGLLYTCGQLLRVTPVILAATLRNLLWTRGPEIFPQRHQGLLKSNTCLMWLASLYLFSYALPLGYHHINTLAAGPLPPLHQCHDMVLGGQSNWLLWRKVLSATFPCGLLP